MNRLLKVAAVSLTATTLTMAGTQTASAHTIGHVECVAHWACPIIRYANDGYWMTKLYYKDTWVRLTKVPGWNNDHVAPITCETKAICEIEYYPPGRTVPAGYYMAKRDNIWVRLTEV